MRGEWSDGEPDEQARHYEDENADDEIHLSGVALLDVEPQRRDGAVPLVALTALRYVLEHEFVHIRRFDALWKLLLLAAACAHWFNPLVWVMYVLANRDLELSCDETVVRRFGGARASYARVLIGMEAEKSGFAPLFLYTQFFSK